MPATLVASHSAPVWPVCGNCDGTLQLIDSDGTQCGTVGAIVPCVCTDAEGRYKCACWVYEWPVNDGFTGWLVIPPEQWDWGNIDEQLTFRPCPVHASCILTIRAEVAA
ncbi:hypothetical protein SMD44_04587 [Streptomyces alboflavus]|uniref:Uncharacterized protein n=1 Tax=Streptomyces alboflavus TaxID=67267 RepID=A0A1Z1WFG3_9ACTN|nr:hypothetical protein [Streptomyces alboflavus]ARX85129.1 hypothetical protein SMD44_04587 [Streptomyces alboflavus]